MSLPTLFAPDLAAREPGESVRLDRSESGHLDALRLADGDRLELVDGRGAKWVAEVLGPARAGADAATCRLVSRAELPPELPVALALGVGRKDRTLWLVEKAVELGVRALQPLELARSRSVADAGRSPAFLEKARRRALAAMKQCGGARLPRLAEPLPLETWLDREPAERPWRDVQRDGSARAPDRNAPAPASDQADPAERPGRAGSNGAAEGDAPVVLGEPLRLLASPLAERTLLERVVDWEPEDGAVFVVGPEGGLTPEEEARCRRAGFEAVGLGSRTLRFETAALAGLAVLAQARAAARARAEAR